MNGTVDAASDADTTNVAGAISWFDDGVSVSFPALAFLEVSGSNSTIGVLGDGLQGGQLYALSVGVVSTGTPLADTDYECASSPLPARYAGLKYSLGSGNNADQDNDVADCAVLITKLPVANGDHVIGTFAGKPKLSNTGTHTIANGTFDVPVRFPSTN